MLRSFSTNLKRATDGMPASVVSFDHAAEAAPIKADANTLRLLSYNIQVGIQSRSYRHYVTRGWQHLLPYPKRSQNLNNIADLLVGFDIVALQEADGGSIRTGHVNQVKYLAEAAGFPYWYQQLNRNLGKFAQHGNGILSQIRPAVIEEHKLPGLLPGRGALMMRFGRGKEPLALVVLHLSLGTRARNNQLAYIKERLADYRHVIVMGDLNTDIGPVLKLPPFNELCLQAPEGVFKTYPSWRPNYNFDQILVSASINIKNTRVLPTAGSDHLPIAMEVELPADLELNSHSLNQISA